MLPYSRCKCCHKFQIERESSILVKHQLCNISGDRLMTKTISRLRAGYCREIKIDRDGRKTYRNCGNYSDTELALAHIFDCPTILAAPQEIRILYLRQQTSVGMILNRLPEQSSGPLVLSHLVQSWT
ncbi:uncharacterized protein TNCV_3325871 [Trichonephila clavipes]|nr:uncharacterized protein TNCV_3325871 [Trichonephila clavipes]